MVEAYEIHKQGPRFFVLRHPLVRSTGCTLEPADAPSAHDGYSWHVEPADARVHMMGTVGTLVLISSSHHIYTRINTLGRHDHDKHPGSSELVARTGVFARAM